MNDETWLHNHRLISAHVTPGGHLIGAAEDHPCSSMKLLRLNLASAFIMWACCAYADIKEDTVNLHNEFRARHEAGPLKWSDKLAATAQAWANNCKLVHGGSDGAGQNLGQGQPDVTSLINRFYSEVDNYTDSNPEFAEETGHFTQVVWKDTKEVACAVQMSCPGGPLWVCHYFPPGNVIGQFAQQVTKGDTTYAPPTGNAPVLAVESEAAPDSSTNSLPAENAPSNTPVDTSEPLPSASPDDGIRPESAVEGEAAPDSAQPEAQPASADTPSITPGDTNEKQSSDSPEYRVRSVSDGGEKTDGSISKPKMK